MATPIGPSREVSTSGDGLAPGLALEVTVMVMVRVGSGWLGLAGLALEVNVMVRVRVS